ncbi:MAG: glycosyltransferase family 39 protein [Leptolyngbya sp. BL-A-14]
MEEGNRKQFSIIKPILLKWLKILAIFLLAMGVFLRFSNLDLHPYWYDETYTSLQISGYGDTEIREQVDGKITSVEDLQKYQYPSQDKSTLDTVRLIAEKEPQLTPLYFVLVRFWTQLFGHSIAAIRSFSAVCGVFCIMAAYWLCIELFESRTVAWIAISMIAISPFHLLYAQEARPYALWASTVLLSHIAMLRAMRLQTPASWVLYTLSGVLSLYAYLFSLLVLLGHGCYLLIKEKFHITKAVVNFSLAFGISIISFVPWLLIFLPNIGKANLGSSATILSAPFTYLTAWVRTLGLLFADFSLGMGSPKAFLVPYLGILFLVAVLASYAIYSLIRASSKKNWLFIVTAIAVPLMPLMLKDLISGGGSSTIGRYLIPSLLGIQIAVAHLFAKQFELLQVSPTLWRKSYKGIFAAVLLVGSLSCLMMVKSELWWNKAEANLDRQLAAQIINKAAKPLLVSDAYFAFALSLSHSLDPKARFLLSPENTAPQLPDDLGKETFLYRPSQKTLSGLRKQYTLTPIKLQNVYNPGSGAEQKGETVRLWEVIKK